MRAALCVAWVVLVAAPLGAQQAAPGCTSAEHAQFDFWVGSWTVTNPAGATVGTSRIEKASRGCAVLESWTDANGVDGHSINFYDPESRTWHQVWMGANGVPLRLQGGAAGPGRMVMTGPSAMPQGIVQNRITWTLDGDGSVEQLWETSTDDGANWQVAFRGIYRSR